MRRDKKKGMARAAVGAIAGLGCSAAMAATSGATVGTVATELTNQILSVPAVLGGASYIAAAVMSIKSVKALIAHSEDHRANPLSKAILQAGVAAMLFALPSTMATSSGTLFGSDASRSIVGHGE
jgi:hypothetical protein